MTDPNVLSTRVEDGIAVVTLAYCVKARREERFLRTELGEGVYDAYARKTPMLVPFV